MNSSVETRYPFLDDDVIAFAASARPRVQAARADREVDPPPGRRADPPHEDRQPPQDDVPRQPGPSSSAPTGRPGSTSSSAPSRCARPATSTREPSPRALRIVTRWPALAPQRFVLDVGLTCVVSTQLWHHLFCGGGLCDLPVWSPPAPSAQQPQELRRNGLARGQ